ncbi:hypothetical protein PV327_008153 [Microctonus hyperodae]|uniref:BTB domain-containing protein n=1 Tax=Microctonus hyperodae TaxID=165561 RepID=A0AA39F2I2_MICHY|nr:hypothetical protein PV327_008153 [Microctonus hyperodae]
MSQPDIQIKHIWRSLHTNFGYTITKPYSASFVDELLPDVEFNIFCDIVNNNSCKIFLSKTPCKPANATVQMLIKYHDEKDEIHEYPWLDDCTFECDFPILDGREQARKHDSPHFISYTFICCITWRGFKEPSQSVNQELYNHLKHSSTLPVFGDTIIVIDKKEIPVHKILLENYSTVFSEMLKAGMTKSANKRIVVTDVTVDIMEKVVEFLYTKKINPVPEYDVLLSIMKVADKYKFKDLKVLCQQKLSEKVTVENVFEIFEKNSLYGGPLLAKCVLLFMVENKSSITELETVTVMKI